jgi:hypothetical protein
MSTLFIILIVIGVILVILCISNPNGCGNTLSNIGSMVGGSRVKKATMAALNMDLVKGGYKAYKKIKGN